MCCLLLQALDSLQANLEHYSDLLPDAQRPSFKGIDCRSRQERLSTIVENIDAEDEFLMIANSDISQLCAQNVLMWNLFLDTCTLKEPIRRHLARMNQAYRIRRFSDGFFSIENPKRSALACLDSRSQQYTEVSEVVRKSPHFQHLLPMPVYCPDMDGDYTSLPIIFEDRYVELKVEGKTNGVTVCDGGDRMQRHELSDLREEEEELEAGVEVKKGRGRKRDSKGPDLALDSIILSLRDSDTGGEVRLPADGQVSAAVMSRLRQELKGIIREAHLKKELSDLEHQRQMRRKVEARGKKVSLPVSLMDPLAVDSAKPQLLRKRSVGSLLEDVEALRQQQAGGARHAVDMTVFLREQLKNNLKLELRQPSRILEVVVSVVLTH